MPGRFSDFFRSKNTTHVIWAQINCLKGSILAFPSPSSEKNTAEFREHPHYVVIYN
jgi:hypothetical protein